MASKGVFFSAQMPHAVKKATTRKTKNLFFALPSIIFSIIYSGSLCSLAYGLSHMARSPMARSMAHYCHHQISSPQRSLERVDPLAYRFAFPFDFLQVLLRNVRPLFGNEKTGDGFKGRAHGHVEKVREIFLCSSSRALGNIQRDRISSALGLRREIEAFFRRKLLD